MKNRIFAGAGILVMLILCAQLAHPLWGVATTLLNPVTVSAEAAKVSAEMPTVQKPVRITVRVQGSMKD